MFSFFKKKEVATPTPTTTVKSVWRNNMWIISPKGVGILFKMAIPCEVHLIDDYGVTKESALFPIEQLRQAKYSEIPPPRRGVSEKRAIELGY
jgi:hypothetical protein